MLRRQEPSGQQFIAIPSNSGDVFPARVNADGRIDLIVSQLGVFLASSTTPGAYDAGQTLSTFVGRVVDVDGDGFDDIVRADTQAVEFNRGVTPFDFGAPLTIATGLLGRFANNDARLDGLVVDTAMPSAEPTLDLYGQSAPREFAVVARRVTQIRGTRAFDVNGDGLDDVIGIDEPLFMMQTTPVVYQCPPPAAPGTFYPPTANLGIPQLLLMGGLRAMADLNGDGKPDQIALTGSTNSMTANFLEVALQQ